MTDMPTDEHRLLASSGKLLKRPEIEEIEEAYKRVTDKQLETMYTELRGMYDVDESVTNEHLKESAKIAIAFDEIVKKHNISAFGYYWWGEKENITLLRSESALAVSRLAAAGIPGVTEGDVKTAMAMKILDLLGGGGMFLEFFSMDYDENFILMGHDGPSNINVASSKPKLQHIDVHHGKTGRGLGIDFDMAKGTCTLMSLSQFKTDKPFKLIYTIAEVVDGEVLNIGNPNCRVRVEKPIPQFFNDWCQHVPPHHIALGVGDFSQEIEAFAEKIGFDCARV
jgi:L-arabinose isomerase